MSSSTTYSAMQQQYVPFLVLMDVDGRQCINPNNAYGFIRHRTRVVILHVGYVHKTLQFGKLFLDPMMTYDGSVARGR